MMSAHQIHLARRAGGWVAAAHDPQPPLRLAGPPCAPASCPACKWGKRVESGLLGCFGSSTMHRLRLPALRRMAAVFPSTPTIQRKLACMKCTSAPG